MPKQSPKELLADWRRMFVPAMKLQARLVVLGTVASTLTAWGLRSSNPKAAASFGATAAANVFIFGFTMSKIMPVNRRLLPEGDAGKLNDEGLRGLLKQWGELHGVRTIAGAAALGAALFGVHCCLAK
ncbi:hypothetical protein COHA_008601 [Chlorella ohadii]|uniref:Uncharacterized protein n=1 Tax=Chlorella ohadii TaxID=2649997 RepID=A0AAD5H1F5_9CHLO|nr:hypothetical protein COHA_008601 [Chlorella ohadii]